MQPDHTNFENSLLSLMKEKPEEKPTLLGVRVQKDGNIHFDKDPHIPNSIFTYKNILFTLRFEKEEMGWSIYLYGSLGTVPYTLESVAGRMTYLMTLCASHLRKDTSCRLEMNTEKNVVIVGKSKINDTLTSTNALTETMRLLCEIEPYMDIIQAARSFKA